MTHVAVQEQIQQQIEVIKKAHSEARKTKESATKFLIDAGIIKVAQTSKFAKKKK